MKPTYLILLAITLVAILWNRKSLPLRAGIFLPLVGLSLLQLLMTFISGIEREWMMLGVHAYHLLAFPLLAFYFHKVLLSKGWKTFFLISIPIYFLAVAACYYLFPGYAMTAYLPEQQLTGLMVIVGTLVLFYQLYTRADMVDLSRTPDFWIGIGNLVYYAGYALSIGSYWYILKMFGDKAMANNLLFLTYILNLFLYSTYTIAFLCRKKKAKS